MGANGRRIREDKEQPAEHAERRRKRNSCQGGHSVSVSIRGQLPKKWLAAHSGGDGSRHGRRPAQERAAPTAFQRTSLLIKCNTPRRDCENFFADVIKLLERRSRVGRTRRITQMKDLSLPFLRQSACSAGNSLLLSPFAPWPRSPRASVFPTICSLRLA